eukprot:scaffold71546_cov21-Tisochrysis_lutea.AAC.2
MQIKEGASCTCELRLCTREDAPSPEMSILLCVAVGHACIPTTVGGCARRAGDAALHGTEEQKDRCIPTGDSPVSTLQLLHGVLLRIRGTRVTRAGATSARGRSPFLGEGKTVPKKEQGTGRGVTANTGALVSRRHCPLRVFKSIIWSGVSPSSAVVL